MNKHPVVNLRGAHAVVESLTSWVQFASWSSLIAVIVVVLNHNADRQWLALVNFVVAVIVLSLVSMLAVTVTRRAHFAKITSMLTGDDSTRSTSCIPTPLSGGIAYACWRF